MNIKETVRWNVRYLLDNAANGDRPMVWAVDHLNKSQGQISQLLGINPSKNIGKTMAMEIAEYFAVSEGWLYEPHPDLWVRIKYQPWRRRLPRMDKIKGPPASTEPLTFEEKRWLDFYRKLPPHLRVTTEQVISYCLTIIETEMQHSMKQKPKRRRFYDTIEVPNKFDRTG